MATSLTRVFLLALLLPVVLPAHARWELATRNPRGDRYYLDTHIVQKGKMYQVWSLVDLVEPIDQSSSVKRLYEADCVKGKLRVMQKLVHAGKGGQGELISADKKPGHWFYPDPASVNEELILKICFGRTDAGESHVTKSPSHATEKNKEAQTSAKH